MANQVYAKRKIQLWAQGYAAGLKKEPAWPTADANWQEGYKKGLEVRANLDAQGISLNKE